MADASQPSRSIGITANWHTVDFTWNGSRIERYLDGELAGTGVNTNTTTVANTDGTNYIGKVSGYYSFDGIIDEVRISKVGRSAAYVKANYNSIWDTLAYYSNEQPYPPGYLSGTVYDKYGRPMEEPCNIIVSDTDGDFVVAATSSSNGVFNVGVPAPFDEHFIVTFYKQGNYGLDHNIAGAMFMTPVSGTGS